LDKAPQNDELTTKKTGIPNQNIKLIGKSTSYILPPIPTILPPPKPTIENMDEWKILRGTFEEHPNETIEVNEDSCLTRNVSAMTTRPQLEDRIQVVTNETPIRKDHPFIRLIKQILDEKSSTLAKPPIHFEFSKEAAKKNWETLEKFGSLDSLIRNSTYSPMSYGSEFRRSHTLEPLLHNHHLWKRFKDILNQGSIFPLAPPPPEDIQKQDFDAALTYKNHKSAIKEVKILNEHLSKELEKGWLIPLLPEDAKKLENAIISPMGVVSQSTINELGEIIPSNRITHDLSFPGKISGTSINSRTLIDQLEPCVYGHMLSRIIHYIVACRLKNPTIPIVLQKIDFKSAYRRMHLNASIATQCLAQTSIDDINFVLLPLRLTFGGSACPAEWCIASEIATDLANKILNHKHWDPKELAPKLGKLVPETKLLDPSIPFHLAQPMIVNPELELVGKSDVYVDDICLVGILSDKESDLRLQNSILLALEIMGRPVSTNEPLPRDELASKSKLLAEAGLSEIKCMLGWDINTRTLRINLPMEKYNIWSSQLNEILSKKGRTTKKIIEIVIGRLNHAASIIP